MNLFKFTRLLHQHTELDLPLGRMNALIGAFHTLSAPETAQEAAILTPEQQRFAAHILPYLNEATMQTYTMDTPGFTHFAQKSYPLFHEPLRTIAAGMGLEQWLASDETGLSSRYLAFKTADAPAAAFAEPQDWDDLARCIHFLIAVPEAIPRLPIMAEESPRWAFITQHAAIFLARQQHVLAGHEVPDELDVAFDARLDQFYATNTR